MMCSLNITSIHTHNVVKLYFVGKCISSYIQFPPLSFQDVISSLQDRLSLRYIEHFALVLEAGGLDQNQKLHLLQENQPLTHVRNTKQGFKAFKHKVINYSVSCVVSLPL